MRQPVRSELVPTSLGLWLAAWAKHRIEVPADLIAQEAADSVQQQVEIPRLKSELLFPCAVQVLKAAFLEGGISQGGVSVPGSRTSVHGASGFCPDSQASDRVLAPVFYIPALRAKTEEL